MHEPLSLARARFFLDNDFGPDGGYDADYGDAEFAGVPYRVPNGPLRAEALELHDLHHLVTGYDTDWRGESEISAWELASGGPGSTWYAWIVALWGMFVGLLALPERTIAAFQRGRGSRNLYGAPLDPALLDGTVGGLRDELAVVDEPRAQGPVDLAAFVGWTALSLAFGVVATVVSLSFVAAASLRCPHAPCSA